MKKSAIILMSILLSAVACGGGDDAAGGPHNDADVAFVTGMIPHHEQAIEMTELADSRAESEEVKDLAARIEDEQGPEIETMEAWLAGWDESLDEAEGHSDTMMSEEEMTELESLSGAEFDSMFLEMMIEHHKSAVTMSEEELAEGESEDAQQLARDIIASQQAQIEEMEALLTELA